MVTLRFSSQSWLLHASTRIIHSDTTSQTQHRHHGVIEWKQESVSAAVCFFLTCLYMQELKGCCSASPVFLRKQSKHVGHCVRQPTRGRVCRPVSRHCPAGSRLVPCARYSASQRTAMCCWPMFGTARHVRMCAQYGLMCFCLLSTQVRGHVQRIRGVFDFGVVVVCGMGECTLGAHGRSGLCSTRPFGPS